MTRITRRDATRLLGGALSLPAVGAPWRASAQSQEFKIGVIASMTGPAAPFFREYVEGFQAYAKSWNTRGGVNGRSVVLNINDDESAPAPAVGTAQERLTIRPIRSAPQFVQITVTLGVAVAIRGAAFLIWGKDPLNVPGFSGDDVFFLWGAILPVQAIWIWGGTAILLALVFVVL